MFRNSPWVCPVGSWVLWRWALLPWCWGSLRGGHSLWTARPQTPSSWMCIFLFHPAKPQTPHKALTQHTVTLSTSQQSFCALFEFVEGMLGWCVDCEQNDNTYIRMLFVDFSSASNTISLMKLIGRLSTLGLSTTNRPQTVQIGSHTSTLVLNTGAPQGCVLSSLLYTLYIHNCSLRNGGNSVKFADYTTITGWISNNNETTYQEEINNLAERCTENNLLLNVSKTKELIIDLRTKEAKTHTSVYISGAEVEQVNSFRFLRISITKNPSWSSHISTLVKKAQKQLYFLRKLKKAKFPCQVLLNFYRWVRESILTGTYCYHLARDTEVSPAMPPDSRAGSFLICETFKFIVVLFCFFLSVCSKTDYKHEFRHTVLCCKMTIKWTLEPWTSVLLCFLISIWFHFKNNSSARQGQNIQSDYSHS